ncbi:hypothetical protein ABU162_10945 [Paenibacillus thiaminolyticus]|uniref:hypothetical protein n=1 Tax=Paenibacillus thiaminolyticus TaxID=49283 RepID=UPI0035A5A4DB
MDVEVGVIVKQLGENKGRFAYRETEAVDTMACAMVYGPFNEPDPANYLTEFKRLSCAKRNRFSSLTGDALFQD